MRNGEPIAMYFEISGMADRNKYQSIIIDNQFKYEINVE